MKIQWEYNLVVKPFLGQLEATSWQRLEGDRAVPELTDLLTGRVRVLEHFGMRRHDAALSSYDSGDVSPHSKEEAL